MYEDVERCVRAVQAKDARFDGWFYTAVVTTGIYCRPSCPTPVTPKRLKEKLVGAMQYYAYKDRSLFEDTLKQEIKEGSRLVYENAGFVSFCPFAARFPFVGRLFKTSQCEQEGCFSSATGTHNADQFSRPLCDDDVTQSNSPVWKFEFVYAGIE